MKIWIVLPAFNEAKAVPKIFDGLRRLRAENFNLELHVILVDDASTDDTIKVARDCSNELDVHLLKNAVNQGLAVTFMRGMLLAAEQAGFEDIVVCMDADNTHPTGQIAGMARAIQEGRDVVVASRYQRGSIVKGVPLFRRFLSGGMSVLFRAVRPIPNIRDYSCGYRAYRAGFLKSAIAAEGKALFSKDGFACMVALLLRLHKLGAVCGEVPLVLRYDQKKGVSKMRICHTILNTIRVLVCPR